MNLLNYRCVRILGLLAGAVTLLAATAVPSFATPTTLTFSGTITGGENINNSTFQINNAPVPPFNVGDMLSGSIQVNVEPNGTFSAANGDLLSFDLTVGPAEFALDRADLGSLSGMLSANGSTLTEIEFASLFVNVPGQPDMFSIGVNGLDQPFTVTSGSFDNPGFATGNFTVAVASGTVVPEPPVWILFGLGLGLIGFLSRRRHSR